MTERIRVGLLGGGKMARQHAVAIRQCNEAMLVAVADPYVDPGELRERFGQDVAAYPDLASMLRDARLDVVHVITPPDTHAALAKECLEHGVHVYVEKPFALRSSEAESVLNLAAARGLRVCAAHQVLFQHSAQAYKKHLSTIGGIRHVESFFSFKPVRRRSGGGGLSSAVDQLIDILPHPVYLLLDALPGKEPARLTALDVSPEGEIRAVIRRADALATLVVSLRARPVESYLRVMGTNGSIEADFVIGFVVRHPGPGASAPSVVLKPFSKAWQTAWGSFRGLLRLVLGKSKSYPGLRELLSQFYSSIGGHGSAPMTRDDMLETVRICEEIGAALARAEQSAEHEAMERLRLAEGKLTVRSDCRGTVLLTGGTGLLGRATAQALIRDGWHVRVPARRALPAQQRLPGVEYVTGDLGVGLEDYVFDGVDIIVHAAAETAGDKADHERNTITATNKLLEAMLRTGVRKLVNIGSVAVLKPSTGKALREDSPLDNDNLSRGPYVWAKAMAEQAASERAAAGQIELRNVRLGPLVDYNAYTPPGRLGREVARLFVAVGRRSGKLAVCSVGTAAEVIRSFARDFAAAPACVNLLEVPEPTRGELADRLIAKRPDLIGVWLPFAILRPLSAALRILLRMLRPRAPALDLYSAFKSETYDSSIAAMVIQKARDTAVPAISGNLPVGQGCEARSQPMMEPQQGRVAP